MSKISALETEAPNTSFINWYFISISFSLFTVLSYLTVPGRIFAPAYSSNSLHALSIAIYVLAGSKPFSNLLLASLLSILFDVFLTLTESKIAASITTFLVSSSTLFESKKWISSFCITIRQLLIRERTEG